MSEFKPIWYLLFVLFTILNVGICLYEDQIGKFDWKQSYLGNVKFGSFDSVKKLIVATEENVLASINLKNGQIIWRQILESPAANQIELLHVDKEIITVSGSKNTWYVRGWDLNAGALLWEWTLHTDYHASVYWFIAKEQLVHIVPVVKSHLEVTIYDIQTGSNSNKTVKIVTPWIDNLSNCIITGNYWACIANTNLYYIDVLSQSNKVYTYPLNTSEAELKSLNQIESDLLLIKYGQANYVRLKSALPRVFEYSLEVNAFATKNGDETYILDLKRNGTSNLLIRSVILEEETENYTETELSNEIPVTTIITALCRGAACRILCKSADNSISLLQLPSGKVSWTREEALSNVIAAELLELPVSELDASIEHEFDLVSNNIIGMLYHRLFSQVCQLSVILTGQQGDSNEGLVRDKFGLHKVIVVSTSVGKLYVLDSITGKIVWARFIPDVGPFIILEKPTMLLFVQRTARYTPLPAQCVLLMKDKVTGNGVLYTFDPISGQSIGNIERLSYRIDQAMLLPYEDDNHLKGLVLLSDSGQVYLYPSTTKSVLQKHLSSIFLYTGNSEANNKLLHGFSLVHSTPDNFKVSPTWTVNFGQAELISIAVRPFSEKVHSQGRVLADRSVLYKYVNPNLLAVATIANDVIHKHVLSVYLIDGITGLVVFSAFHKRARKPVHLVHSENWLVYSYYNEKFRRVELASVELYEGAVQSNSTAFSSHAISQLPHPEMQAYIFPAIPLTMQATLTERGITNKHVLVALSNGAVTEVPWAFLEPRGAQGLLNLEEGYIPYIPELTIPSEATINYNQSLARIRGLQVSPARLESTCLVLVYGLDLFYTRVTPSKTFDLLKEDFDHWLIAVVLIGLTVSVFITKRLASRKALKQAWK